MELPQRELAHVDAAPSWARWTLILAAAYNLLWGAVVVLFPNTLFEIADLELPRYPSIWQCLGMVIGVYGVGYWLASRAPFRHWPIVLVGFLGKIFGPIGFVWTAWQGELDWRFGWTLLTNDLIWWIPFGAILWHALRIHLDPRSRGVASEPRPLGDVLATATSWDGKSLAELAAERPLLLVLLRHSGCVFCREAMRDVAAARERIERTGTGIAFVHLGDSTKFERIAATLGVGDLPAVADPDAHLYRSLGLARGTIPQLFGPRVFGRATGALARGNVVVLGLPDGDGLQLGGLALVVGGQMLATLPLRDASERPDYAEFVATNAPPGFQSEAPAAIPMG